MADTTLGGSMSTGIVRCDTCTGLFRRRDTIVMRHPRGEYRVCYVCREHAPLRQMGFPAKDYTNAR